VQSFFIIGSNKNKTSCQGLLFVKLINIRVDINIICHLKWQSIRNETAMCMCAVEFRVLVTDNLTNIRVHLGTFSTIFIRTYCAYKCDFKL
jgi:hypothetical protein